MPAAVPNDFFKEKRNFTEIKHEIIGKFIADWCNLYLPGFGSSEEEALLYIDCNAGTGFDLDGKPALPDDLLEHLHHSMEKKKGINNLLRSFFIDPAKSVSLILDTQLLLLPYYQQLAHPPVSLSEEINQMMLAELRMMGYPSFLFGNPFSSGLTQEMLLQAPLSGKSDVLLLFCPDSLRKALSGKKIPPALTQFFGERLPLITAFCKKEKNIQRREEYILEHFENLLLESGNIPFLFKINQPDVEEVSHYLLYATQNEKAYKSFKDLLLAYSDYHEDGVPMFVANHSPQQQLSLFPQRSKYSVERLTEALASEASTYKFKSVEKISEVHSVGTPYTRENYLAAYELLRAQGKVEILNAKTLQAIRKPTFASIIKYK